MLARPLDRGPGPPCGSSCEHGLYGGLQSASGGAVQTVSPYTCLSESLKFLQKDPNPNAVTLEGATPLQGTGGIWGFENTRAPEIRGPPKGMLVHVFYLLQSHF